MPSKKNDDTRGFHASDGSRQVSVSQQALPVVTVAVVSAIGILATAATAVEAVKATSSSSSSGITRKDK